MKASNLRSELKYCVSRLNEMIDELETIDLEKKRNAKRYSGLFGGLKQQFAVYSKLVR